MKNIEQQVQELSERLERVEEEILFSKYLDEWEVIDGLDQHRDGLTFKEWRK